MTARSKELDLAAQRGLVRELCDPAAFPHPVAELRVLETHISWVLLTGHFAYKMKKPVDLGFADFHTLALRRHFCAEELRLNRRLAPQLYLDVVAVTRDQRGPRLGGEGTPLDYAVKMRQFAGEDELDRVLERGDLRADHLDALAAELAAFHAQAPRAATDSPFGTPEAVAGPMLDNFAHLGSPRELPALGELRAWTQTRVNAQREVLARRRAEGWVRECHGDVHLANMVLMDDRVVVFDCLEFNPALRWIDVINEIAFLLMDLDYRDQPALARRFLSAYLERLGDYSGLALLPLYRVYRALVRAKVAHIQREQDPRGGEALTESWRRHVALALREAEPARRPLLAITHGVSGCGKSSAALALVEQIGALRVRSDVVRKRLHGLDPLQRSHSRTDGGIYSASADRETYAALLGVGETILRAGMPVVLDATFLGRAQRAQARALAERCGAPFAILDLHAPLDVLRERVGRRRGDASEATLEVLERQLERRQPPADGEADRIVRVDTTRVLPERLLHDV